MGERGGRKGGGEEKREGRGGRKGAGRAFKPNYFKPGRYQLVLLCTALTPCPFSCIEHSSTVVTFFFSSLSFAAVAARERVEQVGHSR